MSATKTDPRVDTRLAELTTLRAALPEDDALPMSMSRAEHAAIIEQRLTIDHRIAAIHRAAEQLASIDVESDVKWRDHLTRWRPTLCDELMAIKSPIRDPEAKARAQSLTFSIKLLDRGLSACTIGPLVTLASLRIGELMVQAGYAVSGRELYGPQGWRGSLPEVEHRIKESTRRKAAALAALDEALLSDAERAKRDAESAELSAAFNSMDVKGSPDGEGLVAYKDDGSVMLKSEMTALQRKAFERMDAEHRRQPAAV